MPPDLGSAQVCAYGIVTQQQQAPGRSTTPRSASVQTPPAKLDDDTIEDVIQRATASAGAGPPPGKDTRTQLFVGNVRMPSNWKSFVYSLVAVAVSCTMARPQRLVPEGRHCTPS